MADSNGGWIKLYWKTKDSVAGSCGDSLAIWTYLLLCTSRKGGYLRNGDKIEPGWVMTSQTRISADLKYSRKVVRRWIDIFEREGMIETKRANKGTAIRIIKWGTYQHSPDEEGQQRDSKGTAKGQQRDTYRDTKIHKSPKKGARPQDVAEVREHAAEKGLPDHAQAFWDHYESNGWKVGKNPMKAWRNAYSGWCRRQGQYEPRSHVNGSPDPTGNLAMLAARKAKHEEPRRLFDRSS